MPETPKAIRSHLLDWKDGAALKDHYQLSLGFEMAIRQNHWAQCAVYAAVVAAALGLSHEWLSSATKSPVDVSRILVSAANVVLWLVMGVWLVRAMASGTLVAPASPRAIMDWKPSSEDDADAQRRIVLLEALFVSTQELHDANRARGSRLSRFRTWFVIACIGLLGSYVFQVTRSVT